MANRQPPAPQEPQLSAQQLRNRIGRLEECINDLDAFDPAAVRKRYGDPQVIAIEAAVKDALVSTFGDNTPSYNRYQRATKLNLAPVVVRGGGTFGRGPAIDCEERDLQEARKYMGEGKDQAITLLRQAIRTVTATAEEMEQSLPQQPDAPKADASSRRKIFVVHGHDEAALQSVARFLEKVELEPIVLKEQPDKGRTIIEEFIDYAGQAQFAIVLLTPDDLGGIALASTQSERARQNVIFELGFFVGQLGRSHVCLMRKGDVEMPSDLSGVIYGTLDEGEGWKLKLVQELKAAGVDLDANKLWG